MKNVVKTIETVSFSANGVCECRDTLKITKFISVDDEDGFGFYIDTNHISFPEKSSDGSKQFVKQNIPKDKAKEMFDYSEKINELFNKIQSLL